MTVDVGDAAPDFELTDQHGTPVKLSEQYRNGTVTLVFYPLAFSGICQGELCEIRDELAELRDSGTTVLAVSVDSMFAHQAWAAQQGYEFPLLADFWPHGEVAKRYGVFDEERGVAVRGTFVIDTTGTVRWKVVNPIGAPRSINDYRTALADVA